MNPAGSVAIVGIGGIFPRSPDLARFWKNILEGVNTAREAPPGRWLLSADDAFDPTPGAPDRVYSRKGCFIDDPPPALDTAGLPIDPLILAGLDPLFHLLLHSGRQAFRDAVTENVDKSRVGVIIGNLALPSEKSSAMARRCLGRTLAEKVLGKGFSPPDAAIEPLNRYVAGLPAGVLAKALDLGGGSYTLDAACASSLYAIKLAMDELLAGRADAMLTGGLSRPDPLYTQMGFSQLRALSPSGTCSPFDARGDGLVVGEGAGIFVLKRTMDAVRDGDHIYGVIRGVGLASDIGGSLLAPSSEGQLRAMRAAYEQAGWSPRDVDLIECHATGTPVGDAVEFKSLLELWGDSGWKAGSCTIGSVKSNIGHLLTAAGSAALIKTLLAFKEETLPPTANFSTPPPGIDLAASPFQILTTGRPWVRRDESTPRRAAVSAFGFGGINAHLLVEEWLGAPSAPPLSCNGEERAFQPARPDPIAIVGMGARFGPWQSLREFQHRVLGGGNSVEPTPPRTWRGAQESGWFGAEGLNRTPFKGFYLDEVALPADEFRIPPRETEEMLPQQALMLRVAAEAIADAGLSREGNLRAGVFIGIGLDLNSTNFTIRWSLEEQARSWAERLGLGLSEQELAQWTRSLQDAAGPPLTANRTMGALGSIVASRIAREFRVGGPSFTISSEESSGIRALEVAVRSLQEGSLDRAFVGAVDMAGDIRAVLGAHAGRPFSTSGTIAPFDKAADGSIVGEGAAAVVLKRLTDAERDGDRIYAVIRGIGAASGGGVDTHIPSSRVYGTAIARACTDAGVDASSIGYMEAHSSGFPPEDAMEAGALAGFFRHRGNAPPCFAGSVKGDIGHSGAASGLASLVKTAICLYQEILPPLRNLQNVRPELTAGEGKLFFPRAPQYWLRNRAEGPRRAAVNSFSVDGNCTHVILEGWERPAGSPAGADRVQPLGPRGEALFTCEGDTPESLANGVQRLHDLATASPSGAIEGLALRWLSNNRPDRDKTLAVAVVARNRQELLEQLEFARHALTSAPGVRLGGNGTPLPPFVRDRLFYSPAPLGREGKVAFVFPGSGNHYPGMGVELSGQWPEVFREQDLRNGYLRSQFQPELFWNGGESEDIDRDHRAMIFGQVALGTAVSDLVRHFRVQPQAVLGYSLGESAGLFSLGAWQDRDLMLDRMNASTLFTQDLAGECRAAREVWQMAPHEAVDWTIGVVDAPADAVRTSLGKSGRVYLLIVNTREECVIGGSRPEVEGLVRSLGCRFFPIHGVTTVHCEVAGAVAKPYRDLHLFATTPPPGVAFYSGAWGSSFALNRESAADAILAQALEGIDFPRLIETAYGDGVRLFLEMGPGASCSRMIGQILADRPHVARSACFPGQDPVSTLLRMLGQLVAERIPVDQAALYGRETATVTATNEKRPMVRIPVGGKPFHVTIPTARAKEAAAEPRPTAAPMAPSTAPVFPMLQQLEAVEAARLQAHEAYLRLSANLTQTMARNLAWQMSLLEQLAANGEAIPQMDVPPLPPPTEISAPPKQTGAVAYDRAQCLEFAVGSLARVLGPSFAEADSFPTRVRLPDEPLMLVDRILTVEGEPRSITSGRVVTEHDVLPGAWYLDAGRIPTCIAVEAGQADLFLTGYLGIDFITRGLAVYRLLDAVVTFHRGLPGPGETIRYDIRIERFFRQDSTYLFRFSFEGTVDGKPLLSMRDGCAGFFTERELAAGKGIVHTRLDRLPQPGVRPTDWREPVPMAIESYDGGRIDLLYRGDLAGCFGPPFAELPLKNPLTLPEGRMKLVDRVVHLDPAGGRFGLGIIRAEADIDPAVWFLTCHFVDDRVMPGTLMYECCLHTLRIYLLRMGWVGEADGTVCEPVPGVASQLKCRGQVTGETRTVTYEVSLKELGYRPEPFAIVDALMYADGKPIVEITNMSVRLTGLTKEKIHRLWEGGGGSAGTKPAIFDRDRILAFAVGKPSEAFGEPYRIFDEGRTIARLPGPPFQFMDRVTEIRANAWKMEAGGVVEAEYDVPPDAWYFAANRSREIPFSVLLEIALQPCGWLAAYIGSALTSPADLCFRNLGGSAQQYLPVTPATGILTTQVRITRVAASGGMIIQNYDFQVRSAAGTVYQGDTLFGFFSREALAQQVGIRDAASYEPTAHEASRGRGFAYPAEPPFPDKMLRMVDRIDLFVPDGGPRGLGFVRGVKEVDPDEWFFKAHFYQDPVCPGSLGLESFLQLLKVAAVERWGFDMDSRLEAVALGSRHSWTYRGQIIPTNRVVTIEAVITAADDATGELTADGFLSVDGRAIYQMNDFTVRMKKKAS